MTKPAAPTIDYYFWLMSDWAYLGGVRFVQMTARRGVLINHIPMRMPDVYARTVVFCSRKDPGRGRPTGSRN